MIQINQSLKSLNILLPNTNRALKEVLQEISPKELETLSKGKDLNSIIKGLLHQSKESPESNKTLLELIKKNPTLKGLRTLTNTTKDLVRLLKKENTPLPLQKQITTFLSDIKNITPKNLQTKILDSGIFLENKLKHIQAPQVEVKASLQELSKHLENSKLPHIKQIGVEIKALLSTKIFKTISNEVLFKDVKPDIAHLTEISKKVEALTEKITKHSESQLDKTTNPKDILFSKDIKELQQKLTHLVKPENLIEQKPLKESLSQDFKTILLKAHEDLSHSSSPNRQEIVKHIEKTLLTIDYQQLVSHLSNATSLFVPYSWDALEEGEISMKSTKNEKFFTDIELKLKEFGLLKLRLGLFEKNQLNININAENSMLRAILKEHLPTLKKQLVEVGVVPMSIRFMEEKATLHYGELAENINAGFEVKA